MVHIILLNTYMTLINVIIPLLTLCVVKILSVSFCSELCSRIHGGDCCCGCGRLVPVHPTITLG